MNNKKVFKATFIIMVVTLLSRCIGLLRDILVANKFGASMITDAYNTAVAAPETVFTIVGLAISTTFIPMLSEIMHKKSKEKMFEFANNVVTILLIIGSCVAIFTWIFPEQFTNLFITKSNPETLELAIFLMRITIINIVFFCLNACFISMLQVCEDFIASAILGLSFNAPIIVYLIFFNPTSILGLTIANVIGNLLKVLVQVPLLYKQGYRFKLHINLKDKMLQRMLILILPVIIGSGASSLNLVVDKRIASSLGAGAITSLEYAQKIITFVNTAFTTSIVSVMYPLMANRLSQGDKKGFLQYLNKSVVTIFIILFPITIGLALLSENVVSLLYGRGAFGAVAVATTSIAFLGYILQLPFLGIRDMVNSTLFSMKKTTTTTVNGVIGVVINITLSLILAQKLGVVGIAIASSIASIVTAILLFISLIKEMGNEEIKPLIIKMIKICASGIIMGVVVYFVKISLPQINDIIIIIINGIVGAITFFAICKISKIEELDELVVMLMNKVKKV